MTLINDLLGGAGESSRTSADVRDAAELGDANPSRGHSSSSPPLPDGFTAIVKGNKWDY